MVVLALVVSNLWPRFGPLDAFLQGFPSVVLAANMGERCGVRKKRRVTPGCAWPHAPVGAIWRLGAWWNLRNGNLAPAALAASVLRCSHVCPCFSHESLAVLSPLCNMHTYHYVTSWYLHVITSHLPLWAYCTIPLCNTLIVACYHVMVTRLLAV
jgi:hypothetical protein